MLDFLRKEDAQEKKETEVNNMVMAKQTLDMIRQDKELVDLYNANADAGSEHLASELPVLKVHALGKSTENHLPDGSEPNDGWFFYKKTQQQYQYITAHILSISRPFRSEGIDGKKNVFNQLMTGIITNDEGNKPFVMYVTGTKLERMWNFGKAAAKFVRAKPIAIPLFALTIRLTTEKIDTKYGKSWVINFEIVIDENGSPAVVTDKGKFEFLRNMVDMLGETVENIIAAKESKEADVLEPNA